MKRFFWRATGAPALLPLLLPLVLGSCGRSGLPATDSKEYKEFVSAFYVGLAGLQTGEDVRAKARLTEATQLAPGEPAAWANLALFEVRQGELDPAYQDAEKARALAPENSRLEELLGAIEAKRGKLPESIAHLKRAVAADGNNVKALYSLAEQTERQGSASADGDAQQLLEALVAKHRDNIAAQIEVARLAAKAGNATVLRTTVGQLEGESDGWPPAAKERLASLAAAATGGNPRGAAVQAAFLRNVLARFPEYRRTLDQVKTPVTFVGDPLIRFLKLPTPESRPAPSDMALRFPASPVAMTQEGPIVWAGALPLDGTGKLWVASANTHALAMENGATLAFAPNGTPGPHSVAVADLNYDFQMDLVLSNSSGVRIYRQQDPLHFEDITRQVKLPGEVLRGDYTGAWPLDIDLDGDLDVVLGTPGGEPVVLRNNGDASFTTIHPLHGIDGLRDLASADMDGDGTPDLALLDGHNRLHVLLNQRLGEFHEVALPASGGDFLAVAAADLNGDGTPDFVLLKADGSVERLSEKRDTTGWSFEHVIHGEGARLDAVTARLEIGDFDNNGAFDVLAGDRLWLNDGRTFAKVSLPADSGRITAAGDVDQDGRLDLLAITPAGKLSMLLNKGTKNYQWQTLRLRAAQGHGDQRINSFGIGGEVEIRSNLLTQRQTITSPVLHFGLGTHTLTDVTRIIWPNGSVQAEFELKPDVSILAEQRLKGSCPSLFAWNGHGMAFVKDSAPWSPALGLRINAQKVANIQQTEEWFKLPGEALAAREGHYDLRVTDELWETFYLDRYRLEAVDHPDGTEVYTDERFSIPAPALRIYTVGKSQSFSAAIDDRGADVSAVVREEDRRYLDTFGRGRYQGVTRDHWVELELPAAAPRSGKLYLIASGWLHPTDATVNIALSQNSDAAPRGLSIEVQDRNGQWVVAKRDLGFLAGKLKTAVLDISDVFRSGAPRRLRLRTNMELYWDRLAWAAGAEEQAGTLDQNLPMTKARLGYRGFSQMAAANASSPEIPDYSAPGAAPRWRDLEGYYTRYGDVRELLTAADDRYVIQNAGDELRLEFGAPPPPKPGWRRDFVMVGNGWVKDGDYNSGFSRTVQPLPYRAMAGYTAQPAPLEKDPAYRMHPSDWDFYQTRYVTPRDFVQALWMRVGSSN